MAVTYTTAAIVKKRIKDISADLTDGDIDTNIYHAEAIIDGLIKDSFLAIFDATKHGIIQSCATDLAAFECIMYDGAAFTSPSAQSAAANLTWYSAERMLTILENPRTVQYLKSL